MKKHLIMIAFIAFLSCDTDLDRSELNSVVDYGKLYIQNQHYSEFLELTDHYKPKKNKVENFLAQAKWDNLNKEVFKTSNCEVLNVKLRGNNEAAYFVLVDGLYYKEIVVEIAMEKNYFLFKDYEIHDLTWECDMYKKSSRYGEEEPIVLHEVHALNNKRLVFSFSNNTEKELFNFSGIIQVKDMNTYLTVYDETINFNTSLKPYLTTSSILYPKDEMLHEIIASEDKNLEVKFILLDFNPKPNELSCDKIRALKQNSLARLKFQ